MTDWIGSDQIDDGGQAFPTPETENYDVNSGMSLRDYFAGRAMVELMRREGGWHEGTVAASAYRLADAMIAASKVKS